MRNRMSRNQPCPTRHPAAETERKGDSPAQLHSVAVAGRAWARTRMDGADLKMAGLPMDRKTEARRQKSQEDLGNLIECPDRTRLCPPAALLEVWDVEPCPPRPSQPRELTMVSEVDCMGGYPSRLFPRRHGRLQIAEGFWNDFDGVEKGLPSRPGLAIPAFLLCQEVHLYPEIRLSIPVYLARSSLRFRGLEARHRDFVPGVHPIYQSAVPPSDLRNIHRAPHARKALAGGYCKRRKVMALVSELAEEAVEAKLMVQFLEVMASSVAVMQLHCYFLLSPSLLIVEVAQLD
jgi:hypothetical protein